VLSRIFLLAFGLIVLLGRLYLTVHEYIIAERIAREGQVADAVMLKRWIGVQQLNSNNSPSLRGVYWLDYRFSVDGQTLAGESEVVHATWDRGSGALHESPERPNIMR